MGSNDAVLQRLRQLCCSALNLNLAPEEVGELVRLDEVAGFDSLTVLNVVSAVEKEFGVTLTRAELTTEVLANLPRLAERVCALKEGRC